MRTNSQEKKKTLALSLHFLFLFGADAHVRERDSLSLLFASLSERGLPVSLSESNQTRAAKAATPTPLLLLFFFFLLQFESINPSQKKLNVSELFLGAPQPRCSLVPRRAAAPRALYDNIRVGDGGRPSTANDECDGGRQGVWRRRCAIALFVFVFVVSQPLPPRPLFWLLLPLRLGVPLHLLLQV